MGVKHSETDNYAAIVDALSDEIHECYVIAHQEQSSPGYSADQSDDTIKEALDKAKDLIELRREFEIIMTGVIVNNPKT